MNHKMAAAVLAVALASAFIAPGGTEESVLSPDGSLSVSAGEDGGRLVWHAERKGERLFLPAPLGLDFIGKGPKEPFRMTGATRRAMDETWTTHLYRKETVRDHANEMTLSFEDADGLRLDVVVRAYDAGFAFRYAVPAQEGLEGFQLKGEKTEWRFADGAVCWFSSSRDGLFERKPLASVPEGGKIAAMPLVLETAGQTVALCEANLADWSGLYYRRKGDGLSAALAPLEISAISAKDVAVIARTPAESPWRAALCADTPLGLVAEGCDVVMNLNPPPEKGMDFSWVEPGASSWDWWSDSNNALSTERTIELVDFAAEMGWKYHTIDGGWYGWAYRPNHGPNVSVEPRRTFDLKRILAHAAEKGVGIFVWLHWEALDDNGVEETLAKLASWGVKGVKVDFIERFDQNTIRWCERVVRAAAKNRMLVNFHGNVLPTGTERTWPNNITREGVYGNEMNKFNADITAVHAATLPFTRFLAGPADYTPGSFGNVHLKDFTPQVERGHRYGDETDRRPIWAEEIGTRAHALALCFAYDSPLLTLCDRPERYRGEPGAEALKNAPAAWKSTVPLAGEIGSHYAVARKAFDGRVYLAALTVEARRIELPLSFLDRGTAYDVSLFLDDPARTPADAKAILVEHRTVSCDGTLALDLADEGGALAIFTPKATSACVRF